MNADKRRFREYAVGLALLFWLGLSLIPMRQPEALPRSAPSAEFSAERALEYVKAIAQRPHPVGTADHARVRDYIISKFTEAALSSEVETGFAEITFGRFHGSGNVENIVARLPGSNNTRPVMLTAHYDSVPRGPGAGDDASGVSVLLETMRALRGSPALRNDVIFLLTDGEEKGMLGAMVFMREHPWRNQPGVVLNFDSRGTGGTAFMYETSAGNEWMIRALQRAVPAASASSFAYEVYRRMPNNTDLTIFKRGGLAGMNFGFIGHPENYHQATDTAANLDLRSVQEQGRYALNLAREFGNEDLRDRHTGDAIYFPTLATPLIVYPLSWAYGVAAITMLILAWGGLRASRKWTVIPFIVVLILEFAALWVSPGASYILAWPLLAGAIAYAASAAAIPGRAVLFIVLPALVFPIVVPLMPGVIVALGFTGSLPMIVAGTLLSLLCVSPQLAFVLRHS